MKSIATDLEKEQILKELTNQRMELIGVEETIRRMAFEGSMTPSNGKILADKIMIVVEKLGVIKDCI